MKRIHTIITGVLTVLLLTSAGVGALSSGQFTATDTAGTASTTTPTDSPADGEHALADHETEPAPESAVDAIADVLGRFGLTDAQEEQIINRVESLQADGASRARLVDAMAHGLHDAGIAKAEMHEVAPELRLRMLLTYFDLTDEQRQAVVDAAADARRDGADAEEVRDVVQDVLESYGITGEQLHDAWRANQHERIHLEAHRLQHKKQQLRKQHARFHGHDRPGGDHPDGLSRWAHKLQHRFDLTDDQINEIQREAQAMLDDGKNREEVKRMVHEKLEDWGKLDGDRDRQHDRPSDGDNDESRDTESDRNSESETDDGTETETDTETPTDSDN